MPPLLPTLLREIHRLKKHIRELQTEIDDSPRKLKVRTNRVTKQEDEVKLAQDALKHLKAAIATQELNLKSHHQQLLKYQKQLGEMSNERESKAKQAEIDYTESQIRDVEKDIMVKMTELEERTTNLPILIEQLAKAKEDFKSFQNDMKATLERLGNEKAGAEAKLAEAEVQIPDTIRGDYNRVVKAHGADALSGVKERACQQCHNAITAQQQSDLARGAFLCCRTCGRGLYPI